MKRKVCELYRKKIVEGDINLVNSNSEIHISEVGGEGASYPYIFKFIRDDASDEDMQFYTQLMTYLLAPPQNAYGEQITDVTASLVVSSYKFKDSSFEDICITGMIPQYVSGMTAAGIEEMRFIVAPDHPNFDLFKEALENPEVPLTQISISEFLQELAKVKPVEW